MVGKLGHGENDADMPGVPRLPRTTFRKIKVSRTIIKASLLPLSILLPAIKFCLGRYNKENDVEN